MSDQSVYEFYAPFAHIPGTYEWCRIHSTTHGSFDCFIVIRNTTADPVSVYVCSENGERFMAERYPESECIRLGDGGIKLHASNDGLRVVGRMKSSSGPVASCSMRFSADVAAIPQAESYGGSDFSVWGSGYACEGVDLNLAAVVSGHVLRSDGSRESFRAACAIIALGSYGKITQMLNEA